jgi:actin-related protein 5
MDSAQAKKKGAVEGAEEADDRFGTDDEDWQVYRDIKSGPIDPLTAGDDEDAQQQREEADQAALMSIEEELERHDESFYAVLAQELSASRTILDRLREPELPAQDDEAARHQLHMNVERWRVPESLFQPQALLGLDSAGLPEAINHLLSALPPSQQSRLTANIFITGGFASTPGLAPRLQSELRALRPDNEQVVVKMAADLQGDAWRGASRIASGDSGVQPIPWITRAWYDEHGGERLPSTTWYTNPY